MTNESSGTARIAMISRLIVQKAFSARVLLSRRLDIAYVPHLALDEDKTSISPPARSLFTQVGSVCALAIKAQKA